jgi:hypothetical protein
VEPSAVNLVLHSRDLTNAVWSGTNVTRAKNSVGADGVVSGATRLTATAASGTVLQAISHASESRVFSAYVRRVTGTGAIQMTTNNGTTWTTVTISSLYTQVACAAQTVASGTVGFRMAVSGDVIEVDFTQGEVGPVATSPIVNTAASGSRSADVVSVSGAVSGSIGQTEGTIYAEVDIRNVGLGEGSIVTLFQASNNYVEILRGTLNRIQASIADSAGSTNLTTTTGFITANSIYKIALGYKSGEFALYVNGTQVATSSAARTIGGLTTVRLGSYSTSFIFNDRIRSAALYTTRLTNAELAALTTL